MTGDLLDTLGLRAVAEADALAAGAKTFQPVHAGTQHLRIGTLLDTVRADESLLPPRTGHLGNWGDIAAGRAGPMDFNTAICGRGYGYPLIYGFTRTEATAEGGDKAYQPGSVIAHGTRRRLPLHTWDGRGFARRDHARPLFCPLVLTEADGDLVPLVTVQWRSMVGAADYPFRQWSRALVDNAPLVVDMLTLLLEQAAAQGRNQAFAELISQSVRLDGEVRRCDPRPDGAGFDLDGHRYASARSLAEATLTLVRALVEPADFFRRLPDLPPVLPVMSLQLTNVLFGLLNTHRPGPPGPARERPFVTHLHWGARAMAGCPPRREGYLSRRSTVRSLRAITDPLVRHFDEAVPLSFVLLPAQAFMLCPPDTSPGDVDAVTDLVAEVLRAGPDAGVAAAAGWLAGHGDRLSPYFRGRFRPGTGVPADGSRREPAVPVEVAGFRDLTFRQACATVAALEEASA